MQEESTRKSEVLSNKSTVSQKMAGGQSPQVRIYNRYFYRKVNEQSLLQEVFEQETKMAANLPKITPQSYLILSEKILREIQGHIRDVVGDNAQNIGYDELSQLLEIYTKSQYHTPNEKELQRILTQQFYLVLSKYDIDGDEQPSVEAVFSLLRILLDPYGHSISEEVALIQAIPGLQDTEARRLDFISRNPQCEEQTVSLSALLQIWRNLKLKANYFEKRKHIVAQHQSYSFAPKICKKSEELARKRIEKVREEVTAAHSISSKNLSHHDILYNTKLKKDITQLKLQNDSECTFKPQINKNYSSRALTQANHVVSRLYYVPQKKDDNYAQEYESKQLKQCTFKPDLSPSRVIPSSINDVKGYSKSVWRMEEARSRKKELQQIKDNLGRVRNRSQSKLNKPPSMLEKEPKIILQIKVDETRIEKIKLYGNEDPRVVANKFVRKNNLDQEMLEVVEDLIRQYCDKYL